MIRVSNFVIVEQRAVSLRLEARKSFSTIGISRAVARAFARAKGRIFFPALRHENAEREKEREREREREDGEFYYAMLRGTIPHNAGMRNGTACPPHRIAIVIR